MKTFWQIRHVKPVVQSNSPQQLKNLNVLKHLKFLE